MIMKYLKFVMFLFYRYYSKGGTSGIPYFSALCAVVFLVYLHIFQLLIIFNGVTLLPMNPGDHKGLKYLKLACFLLPFFLLVGLLVKEKDLRDAEYDEGKIKRGGVYLVIYIVSSFVLLIMLAFLMPSINR